MRTTLGLVALVSLIAACTTTEYENPPQKPANPGQGNNGSSTSPADPGNGNSPSDPSNPDTPPGLVVSNISITEIAVFQAVKTDIMNGGQWTSSRNAPLAANRPARMRVYMQPGSGWTSKDITAELRLSSGSTKFPVIHATQTLTGTASTDADPSTLIDIDIPASSLPVDAQFSLALTAPDGAMPTGDTDARFPTDGTTKSLELKTTGMVKVVVVPVAYTADGSSRTPDTSATMLTAYKNIMMARYPATDVSITVRAPWTYSSAIDASGNGWSEVLNAATQLRQQDGVADDVYYYAAFEPAASFDQYCGSGCVTGLSTVVDDPSTAQFRCSVGIGYTGYDSEETMAHEVGHAHGRSHAPCGGATGVDPQFPYSTGGIGVLGYDIVAQKYYPTSTSTDMMGYCDNNWVSDYTYAALFDRVAAVNALVGGGSPTGMMPQTYRMAHVDMNGNVEWGTEIQLAKEPIGGTTRDVTYLDAAGGSLGTRPARFYTYDHLPGGVLLVPTGATTWSQVKISGVTKSLSR
jgi:hypothetical protein